LRGKQVWLKTMKWDVVFYSHLDDVFTNIQEWTIVKREQPLWTVGITGIPDKAYNDYHLHFPVHKNPFDDKQAGKYDYGDYMKWDWEFKWKTSAHILKHQYDVFEK
jgi:murein DD-endopeptidase MepM/ murein hydrolase activator NlpD